MPSAHVAERAAVERASSWRLALEAAERDAAGLVAALRALATSDSASAFSFGNSLRREIEPELSTMTIDWSTDSCLAARTA